MLEIVLKLTFYQALSTKTKFLSAPETFSRSLWTDISLSTSNCITMIPRFCYNLKTIDSRDMKRRHWLESGNQKNIRKQHKPAQLFSVDRRDSRITLFQRLCITKMLKCTQRRCSQTFVNKHLGRSQLVNTQIRAEPCSFQGRRASCQLLVLQQRVTEIVEAVEADDLDLVFAELWRDGTTNFNK